MSFWNLLFAEIRFRAINFVNIVLAITVAATLFVAGPTLVAGYANDTRIRLETFEEETSKELAAMDKKTKRAMRDLGFNLLIVHKDTNMADFHTDFKTVDMPQAYIDKLANSPDITYIRHLVASLQQRYTWNDRKVLLAGILPESHQSHLEDKPPMGYVIKPGTAILGHEIGLGHQVGETIDIGGNKFEIAKILPEMTTKEDIMLAMHLSDAQRVLGKPGMISQIMALSCKCKLERLSKIRPQLLAVLPNTKISEFATQAIARAEQRDLVAKNKKTVMAGLKKARTDVSGTMTALVSILVPLVVFASGTFVALMTWLNVRERRQEIGVLRALGKGGPYIAMLFISKSVVLGLLGGVVGTGLGYLLASQIGSSLEVAQSFFQVDTVLVVATILGAPAIAVMATYLPMLIALQQDPAVVLQDH